MELVLILIKTFTVFKWNKFSIILMNNLFFLHFKYLGLFNTNMSDGDIYFKPGAKE